MIGRPREREITRRLRAVPAGEPPADLLARLKNDVPGDLGERLAAGRDEPVAPVRSLRWLPAAAAMVMLVGGGFLVWRVFERVPLVDPAPGRPAVQSEAPVELAAEAPSEPAGADDQERAVQERPGPVVAPSLEKSVVTRAASAAPQAMAGAVTGGIAVSQAPAAVEEARRAPAAVPAPPPLAEPEPAKPAAAAPRSPARREERSLPEIVPLEQAEAEAETESLLAVAAPLRVVEGGISARRVVGADTARPAGEAVALRFVATTAQPVSTLPLDGVTGAFATVHGLRGSGSVASAKAALLDAPAPAAHGETVDLTLEGGPSPFHVEPRYRVLRVVVSAPGSARSPDLAGAETTAVEVAMEPRAVRRWRLVGYETGGIGDASAPGPTGGGGRSLTALYEVELADPAPRGEVARLAVRWRDPETGAQREAERRLDLGAAPPSWDGASPAFRLTVLTAAFGEALQGASGAPPEELAELVARAERLAAEGAGPPGASELLRLIRRTEQRLRRERR